MRNWLRRWLGITELERRADVHSSFIADMIGRTKRSEAQSAAAYEGIRDHLLDHSGGAHVVWDASGEKN